MTTGHHEQAPLYLPVYKIIFSVIDYIINNHILLSLTVRTYEEQLLFLEFHLLSGSITLILHSNSDWFCPHLIAPTLEVQKSHDSN